jgi:hypothetical protein
MELNITASTGFIGMLAREGEHLRVGGGAEAAEEDRRRAE